jgi:HEAT repeat protein
MGAWNSQNGLRMGSAWELRLTAALAAFLALAECSGWAQDATDDLQAIFVQEHIQNLTDKNPGIRASACYSLGTIGPGAREAVPSLIAALANDTNAQVREDAADALGEIGPSAKEAIPFLITALAKDRDAQVRAVAAHSLGGIAPQATPALTAALANDTDTYVRLEAALALEQIGPDAKEAVPILITALAKDKDALVRAAVAWALGRMGPQATSALATALAQDTNGGVRGGAALALGQIGPGAKEAVPTLITALDNDTNAGVRDVAAQSLGRIGPQATLTLIAALAKDTNAQGRFGAALALGHIGPAAKMAVPLLITALAKDKDEFVRIGAAQALGQIGPGAKEAVPTLITALAKDTNAVVRGEAARALGQIGPGANEAIPSLVTALAKDTDGQVRYEAAQALGQIAEAARDSKRTDMIEQLAQSAQAMDASSFSEEATKVRTAIDVLRAVRLPWYQVLYETAGRHPGIAGLAAAYLLLAFLWLALLWRLPLALWRINETLEHIPRVKLPDWLGGVEVSAANILLVGFLHYHPRVLDAWVSKRIAAAQNEFGRTATAQQREVHVEVPVELDRRVIPGLKPEDLRAPLAHNSARLLIWGEGGSGKTSLACQIARWAMSDDVAMRLCAHRMLPVLIEQDLDLEVGQGRVVLTEVIRGELKKLTDEAKAPSREMVQHLLERKRLLLIVDGLSELNEATRNKVRPLDPEFAANAFIVTSRVEEPLDGITRTILHPMRIQGNRLSSFMEAYLVRCGKRVQFDDAEFFDGCRKLSVMVGDRDTTVLLAKLYAEQMIASKQSGERNLPENIPALMLQYLNELNRREGGLKDREVHAAAKTIAWECLKETFWPTPAKIEAVLGALGGDTAQDRIDYLEKKLRLVQLIGAGRDRVKFVLDPLAEYLAGLYAVECYRDNEQLWREFLAKVDALPGALGATKGFLLDVRDCCLAQGAELKVPGFVVPELTSRAGLDS